jgi:8-oxo-dGTP pyrophosphatase MutT (NUDIX family)
MDVATWIRRLRELRDRTPMLFPADAIPADFRQSAVLILFWEEAGVLRTVLTRRPAHMSTHPGQIAFAGGMVEAGESFESAAVREAHEEIGLSPDSIEVVGRLDDAWSGSASHLVPFVAIAPARPAFTANPAEVDEILTPDVEELFRPEARGEEMVEFRGGHYRNETIYFPGGSVFGLTADLLLEALEWGQGQTPRRGESRLRDLISYHRE